MAREMGPNDQELRRQRLPQAAEEGRREDKRLAICLV
jgi:hypothetical protein